MIPYKSPLATAVPQNPEVWHEILQAAERLAGESDLVGQRREEITAIHNELELIRKDIAELLRNGRSLVLFELRKYGYNPQEPRIPKHQTGGGQWTEDGAQVAASATDDATEILRPRGGHHFVPEGVYMRLPLKPETKKVFDDARTGTLSAGRHGWSIEHVDYNRAVAGALKDFLAKNGIQLEDMTPEQAQQFVFEVIESSDPVIRDFNLKIYRREVWYYIFHHLLLIGSPEGRGGGDAD